MVGDDTGVEDTSPLPDGWTLADIRRRAHDDTAQLLDPRTPVFLDSPHPKEGAPLAVDLIIDFGSLCLARSVEQDDQHGEWFMGHRAGPGEPLVCWGSYGSDLGAAIDGL